MGGSGVGGGLGATGFNDDYGFGEGNLAGRREERAGVTDGLHVGDYALGVRVVAEVVDQISPPDIHHRPYGDEGREADVLPEALVEDRRHEGAALAQKPNVSGAGHA